MPIDPSQVKWDSEPVPAKRARYDAPENVEALRTAATDLGIDPVDLATVISYETGGTFDPDQRGPTTKWGQHRGLIQFGEPQRAKYGVVPGQSVAQQLPAVVAYLRDAGVKPGMGIMDVYSAINAGAPGRYNRSDTAAGGAPGTVADKVNNQMGGHRKRAEALFGALGIGSANASSGVPTIDPGQVQWDDGGQSGGPAGDVPDYSHVFREDGAGTRETSNPLLGMVDRSNKILGSATRGIANVAEPIGDWLESKIPLSGLTPEQIQNERQLQPLHSVADWFDDTGIDYKPTTTLQDVKDDPLSASTPAFIGERVVTSIPDMLATLSGHTLPAYVMGRTEEVAEKRVENDGRTGDPGLGDMATALPAAAAEAISERFATRLLPGLGAVPGKTAAGRVAAQAGIQSGTEAAQEGAANLGESLGTERGVVGSELGDAMLEGGIVGGGMGGGAQTVAEGVNAVSGPIDPAAVQWDEQPVAPQQEIAQPAPDMASSSEAAISTPAPLVEASPQAATASPAGLPVDAGTPIAATPSSPVDSRSSGDNQAGATDVAADPIVEAVAPTRRAEEVETARMTELRTKRRTESLLPEETDELVTLMERDAHAAKVAGRRIQGVQNMAARAELESEGRLKPVQAFADADDFKSFNDLMGHDTGDTVIRTLGQEFASVLGDGNVFHRGGDEFVLQADNPETMAAAMEAVRSKLSQAEFVMTTADGQTITRKGVGFSYGTGATTQEAENAQAQDKSDRKAAGLRAGVRDYSGAPDAVRNDPRSGEGRAQDRQGATADAERSAQVTQQEGADVARSTVAGTGAVASGQPTAGAERSAGEDQAGLQPEARRAEGAPAESEGAEAAAPGAEARVTTGTKNAVTDTERVAEGRPAREKAEPKSNEASMEEARSEIEKSPGIGRDVVARLKDAGVDGISTRDEAILMAHKVSTRAERDAAAKRATDDSLPAEEREAARRTHDELSLEIAEIDEAAYNSGREWGRLGQLRQRMIHEDFSFEGMERKARMARNRQLTPEELSEIKRQAEQIKVLQEQLETSQKAIDDAKAGEGVTITYAQMVRDLAIELGGKREDTKVERPTLEKLKQGADESRAALRKMMHGQFNSGFDPTMLYHMGRIGAYHIANGAVKLADWIAKMHADLGAKLFKEVEPALEELHAQLKKAGGDPAKAVTKPDEVLAGIDSQNLRSRDVADLARAHILAGTHGEGPVMKAVHADLKKLFPKITEREVRRAFTDYGKATLPSKAADKVELREIRRLVQLQESIDRLREGLAPLKSGSQRDKATQAIREKLTQLNDLLKQATAKYKDSPEKLASYQSARKAALENGIADLEKQIEIGEKAQRTPRPELSEENKKLSAKRDDLRRQLDALDRAKNADKITAARKAVLEEQIARLKRHLDGTEPKPAAKEKRLDPPELRELKVLRDSLRKQLQAIEKPPKSPEQRYQDTREKALHRMKERLDDRLSRDDYARSVRPEPRGLSVRNQEIAFELQQKKQDFVRKQFEYELGNRSPLHKIFSATQETFNLARAIMTSLDLSAVLRQGGFIAMAHPQRALSAVPDMLRAFGSEKAAFNVEDEISKRENAPLYNKYKLEITDRRSISLSKMEEAFMSRLLDKMPRAIGGGLVRGSSRAYSTFLNKLRADSFDAMIASLARDKKPTDEEGKAVATFINAATGRGSLGKFQQSASVLNTVFFAPRWVASRFQMLVGQPMYGGTMRTRALIAKEYARYLIGSTVAMALVTLALGDDEDDGIMSDDPRSTDFMKIRIGNTVIDPLAGLIQPTVLLTRIATREKVTSSGKVQPLDGEGFNEDTYDVVTRFLRTKLAPVPGGLVTLASGSNVIGEEQTPLEVWGSMVAPLSLQDIKPIMEEAGVPRGTAVMLLSTFGMGVQYRDPEGINKDKGVESASSRGSSRGSVRNSDRRESAR